MILFGGYQLRTYSQKRTVKPLALKRIKTVVNGSFYFFINFFFLLGHKQIVGSEAFPQAEFVFLLTWAFSEALVWG